VLVKIDGTWLNPGKIEFVFELDVASTGPGGVAEYRGEPGFVRYDSADGRPVLVNAGSVVALHDEDGVATEIETERGQTVLVKGRPDWVAATLNHVRHVQRVA
jgi:hypothetical protein